MTNMNRILVICGAAAFLAVSGGLRAQSPSYTSGQNVAPAFEGWEQDADGSRYFVFGYMNRNWEEELDLPIGPANSFAPGDSDRGQPTHFLPRRNRFAFRVPVPANFSEKDDLIWTLTSHGKTEKAYASLRTDYKLDDVVKASETGALGAGSSSPTVRANKAPVVKLEGDKTRSVRAGEPLQLVAVVTDDGIPKSRLAQQLAALQARSQPAAQPSGGESAASASTNASAPAPARRNPMTAPPVRITVGKNVGLHLAWYVYRGAGTVTFSPDQIKVWEDTRAGANSPWAPIWVPPAMPDDGRTTVQATFAEPGTYVLRGLADDGSLLGYDDVTVVVAR